MHKPRVLTLLEMCLLSRMSVGMPVGIYLCANVCMWQRERQGDVDTDRDTEKHRERQTMIEGEIEREREMKSEIKQTRKLYRHS